MKRPSNKVLAFNAAAGAIILVAFVTLIHTTFARPNVEVCSTRYNRQLSMQFDRGGVPLTPPELQAVSNGQDEGVLENLSIAQFKEGPTKFAMGVKIAEGTVEQRSTRGIPGGISLPWMPSSLEQPTSACLSYNVFLPADFEFDAGGTLPGFFGTTTNGQFGDVPRFGSTLMWEGGGKPKFHLEIKDQAGERTADFGTYETQLPRGRWLHVEQELILNQAGQSNGTARLWLDGRIEADVKNVEIRRGDELTISGVAGEVYFGGNTASGKAPKDATVWLSPFELRWK